MSNLVHEHLAHNPNEMDFFQCHYAELSAPQYPCDIHTSSNYAVNGLADPASIHNHVHSQRSDFTTQNALGLFGIYEPDTTCSSFSRFQVGGELSDFDSALNSWQSPCWPVNSDWGTLMSIQENLLYPVTHTGTPRDTPPQDGNLVVEPSISSLPRSMHIGASRTLLRSRWPYDTTIPTNADYAHLASPRWAGQHECRWLANGGVCGASLCGTKQDIVAHLYSAHSVHPKGNKSRQVCLWKDCQSVLNKESMPRHILAVHLKEKARCPSCHSSFARSDSLRRHSKTCRAKKDGTTVSRRSSR